ncbi:MAG: biotin--[acetyl-CoA-carboxylase] ligase [Prolixibacteraceae bacterium]
MAEIIGNAIIKLMRVDSTNNYATAQMAIDNWNEGTVVLADEQIRGRGQINNGWESEANKNLLFSIVLYPEFLPVQNQFLLSKVVAVGIQEVLSKLVDNVKIKWPNDIYVANRKIAGILIENSIMGNVLSSTVIGIGLNVNQRTFYSAAPNPVSLCQLLKQELDLADLLTKLFNSIDKWYCKLKDGDVDEINSAYVNKLYQYGEVSEYEDDEGVFVGELKGVNSIGQLLIQPVEGEMRCYHFKEVRFL